MFSKAVPLAAGFTRPVVISSRTVEGRCMSAVGAAVLVNREGWLLTAAHLIGLIQAQAEAAAQFRRYEADIREMDRDRVSHSAHRRRRLRHLDRPARGAVRDHSVWWGADGAQLVDVQVDFAADLAIGRLEPFDPASASAFPAFKTPDASYAPGRSLCRLGFPFHEIEPEFDEAAGAFLLPEGAVPLPLFPIDGLFTRVLRAPAPGQPADAPGLFIETSSPGLQGQSGGPIFDTEGTVWGLQSHTRHHALGFRPQAPGAAKGQVAHQFLNVGVGVHAEPLLAFLDRHNIAHRRA